MIDLPEPFKKCKVWMLGRGGGRGEGYCCVTFAGGKRYDDSWRTDEASWSNYTKEIREEALMETRHSRPLFRKEQYVTPNGGFDLCSASMTV